MPRQINRHKRQSPLGMPRTLVPRARRIGKGRAIRHSIVDVIEDLAERLVVRHVEVLGVRGRALEALQAVPRHVLDGDEGAVGEEQEVEQAVADDGVVCALDDRGEGAEG